MHRPIRPGGSTDVQKLAAQVAQLEKQLAALQKCVQVDAAGQNLTLKAPADITIEAGTTMDLKGGMVMTLVGSQIKLN